MRRLKVEKVTEERGLKILAGTVEGEVLRTGDEVLVLSKQNQRDPGMVSAVMPNGPGAKSFDEGAPGAKVKVALRRKSPTFELEDCIALESMPKA